MEDFVLRRRLTVDIRFFVDGGIHASRRWPQVPRVGDEIMLGAGKGFKADRDGKAAFKVVRVVWGTESDDHTDEQCCDIELERIP